jgi:hypothetical protein
MGTGERAMNRCFHKHSPFPILESDLQSDFETQESDTCNCLNYHFQNLWHVHMLNHRPSTSIKTSF